MGQPPASDPLFLEFQSAIAGRYSIDRELGRGGMGVVYLAREVHLDRLVAIKLLPPALAERPELRERFLREARVAARLSHPHIIPIHAVEQAGAFVYFVMAYVDGETLAQRVQSRGPLAATDCSRLLREVAWALGHAHAQGVVHRDVKPDNILIEHETGRALVADFGIAAAAGDVLGSSIAGTPEFMSPEHARGHEVDARSDLYSLGATAFYALSGRLPFEGGTTAEILSRQIAEPAPSLASVGAAVPRRLAQLVDRCLAKSPSDRPQHAQAMADQLGAALEQRRELPAALRAFVKRNGRMDGGGTVLSLLGSLAAGVATSIVAGPAVGVATLLAGAAVTPIAFGIVAARRLMDQGFTQADLEPAFRVERESSREERGIQQHRVRMALEWTLKRTASIAASTSTALLVVALAAANTPYFSSLGVLALAGLSIAAASTIAYVTLMQLRRDVDIEFWSAAWTGRFGSFAFSVARRWRGSQPAARVMTHRATELSLGMAAEELFESLPLAQRQSLGDLPSLLQRLQRDAHALRSRLEQLQAALLDAGGAAISEDYAPLREERDAVGQRLGEAVAALETIRLNLLRLHAGSLSIDALTTHIGLAEQVSADVARLMAAQQEVEDVLRFPRSLELTPV